MLVSYNLLKKYVDLPDDVGPAEVAEKLTMSTVEVEGVIEAAKSLENIVVGKVVKLLNHPNANKLKLALVEAGGKEPLRVVCGGVNLKSGRLVAFAKVGAMVRWHGEGEPVKLEKAKIRGEESTGMICAANEIGLFNMFPHGEMEILDLSHLDLKVGEPLAEALGLSGIVFDIDNKSLTNRPDLWGHYGIARELAAIYNLELKEVELDRDVDIVKGKNGSLEVKIEDGDLCQRYLGCVVEGVKVGESPDWLKKELRGIGHNTFNNIVDITNYVMEELGQPMHAFDLDKLKGNKIIVRRAKKSEKITTLDNVLNELDDEMLVIADSKGAVALAGIMGGLESGVSQKTGRIVLEAANFSGMSVRRDAQKLNLRTEASIRFEKELDPSLAEIGMRRALELIKKVCPQAKNSGGIVEDGEWQPAETKIKIKLETIYKKIGHKIDDKEVLGILGRLGFEFGAKSGVLSIRVPSWRSTGDVSIAEDIVEEVARIYGYDNLEEVSEMVELRGVKYQKEYSLEGRVKNYLSLGAGMSEVFNYPWADGKMLKKLGLKGEVAIANPPTEEYGYLQSSLVPNIVQNVEDNLRYVDVFRLYELARVYLGKSDKWDKKSLDKLPHQPKFLAGAVVEAKDGQPFLEVKGIIGGLFKEIGVVNWDVHDKDLKIDFIDNSRSLEIVAGKDKIGWLGEVDYAKIDCKNKRMALFEIDFEKLMGLEIVEKKYMPLVQFPSIERDIAVEVEWAVSWVEIRDEISGIDKLISNIVFLSEYGLKDKKSLAFRVVYQADRTLKDSEVVKIEKKILDKLKAKFKAERR